MLASFAINGDDKFLANQIIKLFLSIKISATAILKKF